MRHHLHGHGITQPCAHRQQGNHEGDNQNAHAFDDTGQTEKFTWSKGTTGTGQQVKGLLAADGQTIQPHGPQYRAPEQASNPVQTMGSLPALQDYDLNTPSTEPIAQRRVSRAQDCPAAGQTRHPNQSQLTR